MQRKCLSTVNRHGQCNYAIQPPFNSWSASWASIGSSIRLDFCIGLCCSTRLCKCLSLGLVFSPYLITIIVYLTVSLLVMNVVVSVYFSIHVQRSPYIVLFRDVLCWHVHVVPCTCFLIVGIWSDLLRERYVVPTFCKVFGNWYTHIFHP